LRDQLMSRARLLIFAVLAVMLWLGLGGAGANPFTGKPDAAAKTNPFTGAPSQTEPGEPAEVERAGEPVAVVGRALVTFQREANRTIAHQMRAIRDGETALPLLIGIMLAFAYGVVHALGPGHGKVVVVSYFLSRDAQIMRGFMMGLQIAVTTSSSPASCWSWPSRPAWRSPWVRSASSASSPAAPWPPGPKPVETGRGA
jgi:hypothetical protein